MSLQRCWLRVCVRLRPLPALFPASYNDAPQGCALSGSGSLCAHTKEPDRRKRKIMSVMLQAFYWDCPEKENKAGEWWNFVNEKLDLLKAAGFNSLWLPPVSKAASVTSMGYDPYDYFDLGDFDQKGGVKTYFGNRAELEKLIAQAHQRKMQVYADMVINHNSGADREEK